ncbi:MAG: hypothetical protein IID42_09705 [Planctomycetes bacterium]|nr:hypothetical protein [Planctomycetota bacterium]
MEAIDLDEALTKLTEFEERKWRLVEHRLFGGLTNEQVARSWACHARRLWMIGRLPVFGFDERWGKKNTHDGTGFSTYLQARAGRFGAQVGKTGDLLGIRLWRRPCPIQ